MDDSMNPQDKAEMLKSDEEFAAMLQRQFDEEVNGRVASPEVAHPASPIEERLSSFTDSQIDPGFGEELSAQLLKHINNSTTSCATQTSKYLENGTRHLNGLAVNLADQPSTSSTSLSDEQLSEEYARRLQQEFDNEARLMSTTSYNVKWDPISEWRTDEEDDELRRALEASLMDQPTSSKSTFYPNASTSGWKQETTESVSNSGEPQSRQNDEDQKFNKNI